MKLTLSPLAPLSVMAVLVLVAGGCTKHEENETEHSIKQVGHEALPVAKKATKTVVGALDKAADTTTDAAITGSVKTRLLADQWVGATKIEVTTKNHIVTLTGKVPSHQQSARAATLAKNVIGVHGVVNKLGIAK